MATRFTEKVGSQVGDEEEGLQRWSQGFTEELTHPSLWSPSQDTISAMQI
ncbi:hypothetical protein [Bacillus phage 1_ICo-2020]|uniref:Uncharacterized protein n=1 Tax=Bacillus phage 1_ICo-2020 TaxID=2759272 RepID=A0A7G8AKI1_9CAUD|nr:hypothetical protein [Bacillus phage 1_ICo-2020]